MMNRAWTAALVVIALVSGSAVARADTIKFCIEHTGTYDDSNSNQDFWTTNTKRLARGAIAQVNRNGTPILSPTFLGDGLGSGDTGTGCTPTMTVSSANASYAITVWSGGYVNGNYVVSVDHTDKQMRTVSTTSVISSGSGTYTVEMSIPSGDTFDIMNVYNAGAYSIYRHAGGLIDKYYTYEVNAGTSGRSNGGPITICSCHGKRKFVISHETGHHLMQFAANNGVHGKDTGASNAECDETPSSESHSLLSKEYSGAAFYEGFANFYAADVWNDDDETDCSFQYWKPLPSGGGTVNCQTGAGSADFPNAYMEANCTVAAGRGVELDWMRAFWYLHTVGAAPDPSFNEILAWVVDAALSPDWDRDSAYQELIWALPFASEIYTSWPAAASVHGVDH
jgi:hypothetical protein